MTSEIESLRQQVAALREAKESVSMKESELIAALEAAEGPSRELDGRIALANGWQHETEQGGLGKYSLEPIIHHIWVDPKGERFVAKTTCFTRDRKYPDELPYYTSSIDAARSISDWILLTLSDIAADGLAFAELGDPGEILRTVRGIHSRPTIALCIAGVRALGAQEG